MEPAYAPRRRKPINKKNKLHIVFDEAARREFLTGFHKRKLLRKKIAEEELQQQLKAERKRIKLEAKERFKKLVHSYKPIPELEEQLAQEYKVENATVSVLELDTDLLAETNFLIGRNRGTLKEEPEIKVEVKEEVQSDDELPGMELSNKREVEEKQVQIEEKEMKTKKELKKEMKKQATKKVKNSKIFQRKNKLESLKQKKKSMRLKKENLKIKAKSKKGRKQTHKNRRKH